MSTTVSSKKEKEMIPNKFKGIIVCPSISFAPIYRSSIEAVVKFAKKEIKSTESTRKNHYNQSKAPISIRVFQGSWMDTPYFSKKRTIFYSDLVHIEVYEEEN